MLLCQLSKHASKHITDLILEWGFLISGDAHLSNICIGQACVPVHEQHRENKQFIWDGQPQGSVSGKESDKED